jgi:hypothetical protein
VTNAYGDGMEIAEPELNRMLERGLDGYVREVAAAVGIPAEGTTVEISDTATAYLGLSRPWPGQAHRDVMLVWSEQRGWSIAVETTPAENPVVVARWADDALVPPPDAVARFVTDAATGDHVEREHRYVSVMTRQALAERLRPYLPAQLG